MSLPRKSRARDWQHQSFERPVERVRYCMHLMANLDWERGKTAHELVEDWGLKLSTVEDYAAQASRTLELLGQREELIGVVRTSAWLRLEQAEDAAFVQLSRLLVDTVGGFEQRHKVEHSLQERNPAELAAGALEYVEQHLDGLPGVHERILAMAERIRGNRALLTDGTETTEHPSEKRHDPVD